MTLAITDKKAIASTMIALVQNSMLEEAEVLRGINSVWEFDSYYQVLYNEKERNENPLLQPLKFFASRYPDPELVVATATSRKLWEQGLLLNLFGFVFKPKTGEWFVKTKQGLTSIEENDPYFIESYSQSPDSAGHYWWHGKEIVADDDKIASVTDVPKMASWNWQKACFKYRFYHP